MGGCVYLLLQSEEILSFEIVPELNADNSTALHFSLILIVITVFGFLFVFTFLGFCGAACTNRCMLGEESINQVPFGMQGFCPRYVNLDSSCFFG